MPNDNLTEIIVLLDRSGSMDSIRGDMEGGFDSFVREQRAVPGDCRVSLFQFDDQWEKVYESLLLSKVPPLKLVPRDRTALLDAMGKTIMSVGGRYERISEEERPGKVVFMTITDGKENASREWSKKAVFDKVKHQQNVYSWQFAFLGANIDSWGTARDLGIQGAAVMDYQANAQGVGNVMHLASAGVAQYRSATRGASLSFDPKVPPKAKKEKSPK